MDKATGIFICASGMVRMSKLEMTLAKLRPALVPAGISLEYFRLYSTPVPKPNSNLI